jgi:hypothetical protein
MYALNTSLPRAIPCLVARMKSNQNDPLAMLGLASILSMHNKLEDHSGLKGVVETLRDEPFVKHWWYLGPFPIGKHEIDGDPTFNRIDISHGLPVANLSSVFYCEV